MSGTAANGETGEISGFAEAQSGQALEGVTIVATSSSLAGSRSDLTGIDGGFSIGNLPPGMYEVVSYYSDQKVRLSGVLVAKGVATVVEVRMSAEPPLGAAALPCTR